MRRERDIQVWVDCQEIRNASECLRTSFVQVFTANDQHLLSWEDAEPALELPYVFAPGHIAGVLVRMTHICRIPREAGFFAIKPLQFGIECGGEIKRLLAARPLQKEM